MARRGRPCRVAGEPSRHRVETRLTAAELRTVHRLARANDCSVADLLRLGALTLAGDLDDGDDPPVVLAGRLAMGIVAGDIPGDD